MRRVLAILVFALAAGAATAFGAGVVVAPHIDPPGTPHVHSHVLAAYRLPIFLDVLRAQYDPDQGLLSPATLVELETTVVLALLALVCARLPRPTQPAIAELARARVTRASGERALLTGPPRVVLPI